MRRPGAGPAGLPWMAGRPLFSCHTAQGSIVYICEAEYNF